MANNADGGRNGVASPPRRQRRRVEIRQIEDFLAVLAYGTLGDAARKLRTSQPALTKSIRALERSLGGELFFRSPQGMKPTAFAQAFEARARVIVGEIDRAQREVDELLAAKRGKVLIGSCLTFANTIIPEAFRRFRHDYPGIDVTIIEGLSRDLVTSVLRGELDYSFVSGLDWFDSGDVDHEILLRNFQIHIVGGRDNPLTATPELSLREVSAAPWALPLIGGNLDAKLNALLASAGLPPIKPVLECDSAPLIKILMGNNDMLSIFYDALIQNELEQQTIKILRVPEMTLQTDFGVIFRRRGLIPPAAAKLLDVVRKVCTEYQRDMKHEHGTRLVTPRVRRRAKPKKKG